MKTLPKWGAVGALTAAAALPVLAIDGTASAAPAGNSPSAHACQKGGYATLEGTNGTLFSTVGACVSYAAHGGTLEAIPTGPPSVSLAFTPAGSSGGLVFCAANVTLSDFAPNTAYSGTATVDGVPGSFGFGPLPATNASGNVTAEAFSYAEQGNNTGITVTVNGVSSSDVVIAC
jgi:hypothetical protein